MKGILFQLACAWRAGRINDLRRELDSIPPQFISSRLTVEAEIAYHRTELGRLFHDGTVWPYTGHRAA